MSTCQIHERYPWIKCQNATWASDPEGLCLLHSRDQNKDKDGAFSAAVKDKLAREDYDFRGVFFPGPVSFERYEFKKDADFSWATFSGGADFSGATFTERADFSGATFSSEADFSGATFSGGANFSGATFSGLADFRGAIFSGEADFSRATFSGEADFSEATFSGEADFIGAIFSGEADFSKATFSGEAEFFKATFSSGAGFSGATFSGDADFPWATFSGRADFSWATFSGRVIFRDLNKPRPGDPPPANLEGTFTHLELAKEAVLRFQDLSLAEVEFAGTNLRHVDFRHVAWHPYRGRQAIYDEVLLRDREKEGKPWFWARFWVWLTCAQPPPEPTLADEYGEVERLYRNLKINYETEGDYKNAGDFHYGEMEMHRRASKWRWFPFYWYNLYRFLSGYGEGPVRALICLAGLILGLATLVWWLEPGIAGGWGGLRDALFYILAQATFQRPDWFKPETNWGEFIRIISPLLIPGQAALFLLALRNRLGRRR